MVTPLEESDPLNPGSEVGYAVQQPGSSRPGSRWDPGLGIAARLGAYGDVPREAFRIGRGFRNGRAGWVRECFR